MEILGYVVARKLHERFRTDLDEIAELVNVAPGEVRHSLRRQRDAHTIVPVTKGAWVPVPPQFRRNGAPPVDHFIDPLMVFQVVTDAKLRDRRIGAQQVAFARRRNTAHRATERRMVPTGCITVAAPEVVVLDLVEGPHYGAGLSNVATVIAELLGGGQIDPVLLAEQAQGYPTAVVQLVGTAPPVDLRPASPTSDVRDNRWNVTINIEIELDL